MRYSRVIVLALSTAIVVVGGCSSDDDDDSTGGKGGKGGSGGKAGAGGKGSSGGKAGSANAGKGGVGGKGGNGGNGGNGGDAGACIEEVALHPLSASCGSHEYATVSTECSFADTCKDLDCGKPFSDFDANGCRRWPCDSSDTCDTGERCVPAVLHGEGSCRNSVYENCKVDDCNTCWCGYSADCISVAFCLPEADFPTSSDCSLAGLDCGDLEAFSNELDIDDEHFEGDTQEATEACRQKVSRALDTCNGVGGAGGQSGNGGQAGN